MSYSLAQSQHSNAIDGGYSGNPTTTLVLPGNTVIGNLLVFVADSDTAQATTVTPSGLGTWAKLPNAPQHEPTNNEEFTFWWAVVTSAGTTITVTATGGNAVLTAANMAVCEINSTLGFDASPLGVNDCTRAIGTTGTGTDAETATSVSPSAGDLLVAAFHDGAVPSSIAPGTGFTTGVIELGSSGNTGACAIEFQSAAGGAKVATFTVGTAGQAYTVQVAAFKPATASVQTIKPDADIVTTGWSTAPLFSQINDGSDGTVITAVPS